jgi:hypothetical protein
MNDNDFQELVDKLFIKHAKRLGGDHWAKGDLGLDEYWVVDFAKELKEILENQKK